MPCAPLQSNQQKTQPKKTINAPDGDEEAHEGPAAPRIDTGVYSKLSTRALCAMSPASTDGFIDARSSASASQPRPLAAAPGRRGPPPPAQPALGSGGGGPRRPGPGRPGSEGVDVEGGADGGGEAGSSSSSLLPRRTGRASKPHPHPRLNSRPPGGQGGHGRWWWWWWWWM